MKKDDVFQWKVEHHKAFHEIKSYLIKPPILLPPIKNKVMKLYIEASWLTTGSMLAQEDEKMKMASKGPFIISVEF